MTTTSRSAPLTSAIRLRTPGGLTVVAGSLVQADRES
jgi:hypothetical protein